MLRAVLAWPDDVDMGTHEESMSSSIPLSPAFGHGVAWPEKWSQAGSHQSGGWGEEGETSQELDSTAGRKLNKNKPCEGSLPAFLPFGLTQFA